MRTIRSALLTALLAALTAPNLSKKRLSPLGRPD